MAALLVFLPRDALAARIARNLWATQIYRGAVTLYAGYEYEFRTNSLDEGVDPVMHLLDGSNHELTQNDDYASPDRNARLGHTPSSTGVVVVVVRAFSEYAPGLGVVEWRQRPIGGAWSAWTAFTSGRVHFGGVRVALTAGQREYWTVAVQPAASGVSDTVLYVLDGSSRIMAYDDDSGVGYMSRASGVGFTGSSVLVGTYGFDAGYADVIANDLDTDSDGDGLGAGLEAELGTCESGDPRCSFAFTTQDSDHDGLSDFHETFGLDTTTSLPSKALHLPAWGALPTRKDVFIEADFWIRPACCLAPPYAPTCTDPELLAQCSAPALTASPLTESLLQDVQSKYLAGTKAEVMNLVGDGIALHLDVAENGDPCPGDRKLCGAWGGGGNGTNVHALSVPERAGVFRHLNLYPSDGQAEQTSWTVRAGPTHGAITHELGHSLGLSHGGHWRFDTSDPTHAQVNNCKNNYPSLMNYAFDGPWSMYNFSHGTIGPKLDPARVHEASTFGGLDASRLQFGAAYSTGHVFPIATSAGVVDWNRDGQAPNSEWVRGSLAISGWQCGYHAAQKESFFDPALIGAANDDIAAFGGHLYVFHANSAQTQLRYRSAPHNGSTDAGGCTLGTGVPYENCHAWTLTHPVVPGVSGTITSVAVLPWAGYLAVAYRTSDSKVWINLATGPSSTGELSWVTTTPTLITSSAESSDIELSPMYVKTEKGFPATELLAVFYTRTYFASTHVWQYATTPSNPLLGWSTEQFVTLSSGAGVDGGQAPGVTVWPARSATGSSYSSVGGACGDFPGPAPDFHAKFLCYDKVNDWWTDLTATAMNWGGGAYGNWNRRPSIVFHTLRRATPSGAPPSTVVDAIDPTMGQFWHTTQDAAGGTYLGVSTLVSSASPPGPTLRIYTVEPSWRLRGGHSFNLYTDRDLSAIKGISSNAHPPAPNTSDVDWYQALGHVDGAWHWTLGDGNDFHVMELGICFGLRGHTYCGHTNTFGYDF